MTEIIYSFGACKKQQQQQQKTKKNKKKQVQGCISMNFEKYFRTVLLWSTNQVLVNSTLILNFFRLIALFQYDGNSDR